jgi:hypothetical protein
VPVNKRAGRALVLERLARERREGPAAKTVRDIRRQFANTHSGIASRITWSLGYFKPLFAIYAFKKNQ